MFVRGRGTLATFPGQCGSAGSAGTMVAARTKEANHLKFDIVRAPQPGWLKTLWAHGLLGLDGLVINFSTRIRKFLGRIMKL
jgi:hypothetical protein